MKRAGRESAVVPMLALSETPVAPMPNKTRRVGVALGIAALFVSGVGVSRAARPVSGQAIANISSMEQIAQAGLLGADAQQMAADILRVRSAAPAEQQVLTVTQPLGGTPTA